MCDQTEVAYLPGEVVWVKLRALWWPGLVEDYDKLPEEITCSLRKRPIATVKFFQEDSYEYVHKLDLIYHYNCSRKHEFIKKGLDLCRKKTADRPGTMDFFPADVVTAEELTNGDPNILQHKTFKPEEKPKYTSLFGSEKKKFGKKKGKEDSPLKDKAARRKKLTSKLQAMGWLSRGITANIIYPSPDTPRIVTHRRFLNKVRNPDAKSDYESRILEQKCEDEPCSSSNEKYHCVICGYVTRRLNVIVLHFNSTHSRQTKNIFTAPSVLKGGSLCNPLLKLKSESRKSDSGRIGFFSRKRKSTKKPEKVKQESDMDSSEEEVVKAPVKKEKGKRGRKRKIRPEEEEKEEVNENVIEPVKKPKVLDSLLADWEDGDQDDEELESSSRLRSEDEDNDDENDEDVESASVDNETIMSGKSSVAEDTSASKSKEVFEFDPDEDDSIDLDLTPNVKGFGRRIPRVIDSPKEKKQAKTEPKKFSKGKASKKKKEDVDDFESLLAETSMPSLPSLPKSKSGTIDAEDDSKSDESNTKPVLKEQNEADNMKIGEEESKNSNSEVDLAVGSKSPPQAQNAKGTAKVTVEKIPDLAVVSTEVNEEADLDNQKHDSGPEKSSGSDHTYMGSTGRRRRRSLLPLEKNEESMDIMSMPVVMDDVVEESSPVSKEPMLPAIDGCKVHAPRRGRPPKRGRGGRGGSRSLKGRPPQDPKSTHHRRSKSPSPHLSSSKSPPPHQSPKSPSSHSSSMSPPPLPGPKSPPPSEWSPKNSPNRQSSKSPSAHGSKKHSSKSPVSSPHLSPAPKSPGPRSPAPKSPDPRSPAPKSPSSRSPAPKSPGPRSPTPKSPGPRSPAPLSPAAKSPGPKTPGPKSPEPRSPGMKSPGPKSPGPRSPEPELKSLGPKSPGPKSPGPKSPQPQAVQSCLKTPPQSPIKAVGNSELPSAKSPVKSVQVSAAQTVLLSPASPLKSTASKILTPSSPPPMKAIAGVKKVSTPGAVVVQSKPDLQPEACGLAKTLSLSPSSVAASSSGTVKTIKVAVSGSSGSSPMLVGKAGTPGSKVMIVRGGQKMLLPAEASQQFLSNIGSGKKIMVITKSSPGKLVLNSQQQKILASGGKITTSTGQVISKGSSVMSSVAKLLPSKASTSTAASSAGGVELSSEPPALVKTDGKKTYKIITSPQSPGNILLNTSGRQILLPVSSIAASGSGVTTTTGSKQFILPVGAKNMKFLNAVGGSGQKVILQMKSSPAKAGLTPTKTVQPIVPKTVQSISPKTAQPLSPKAVPSLTPKTIQPTTAKLTPKMAQPITPKTSQPVKVTKIATMIQGVPQLTPIGSPKIGKTKPVRKSSALGKAPEVTTSSSSVAAVITPKKNSGIIPNPNLKTIVPQVKPAKKISLAVKPTPAELPAVSSMPAGGVQVVAGSIPGLEQIQTIVPSVETSGAVGLATSTQQFITGLAEDGSQVMYLLDNSQLMGSLDGSGQPNLGNMIITMDNMGQPVLTSAASDFTFSTPSSGQQDILAEALANTQVLQPEAHGGDLGLDTSGLLSSHASTMYPPTLSHGVLETSLTLNQPIMTPLEDLSAVSSLQPPPATGAATTVDLPSTITVPDITISTSSYASLPIPSATIQSTVFSEAQNITTFSTSTADGSVFIEAPVAEGESFLTTDTVYEQTGEGASMPLLDG